MGLLQSQGRHAWIVRFLIINIMEWKNFVVQSCPLSESRNCLEMNLEKESCLKACFNTPVWSGSIDCGGVVFMSKYSDKRMNHVLEFLMKKIKSQFKLE